MFDYFIELRTISFCARRVVGRERLGAPYRLTFTLTDDGDVPDPDELVPGTAAFRIERSGVILRRLFGTVTEAIITATADGFPAVEVTVEPRMTLLRHRSDARVFRDMSAVQIVHQVLGEVGVGCYQRLGGAYKTRPYCVQYRETDFDFVHRLLEEEGIFYTFLEHIDHTPDDPLETHGLVLGDGAGSYDPIDGDPKLPFRSPTGLERTGEAISRITRRASMGPGRVVLSDWNLETPSLSLMSEASGPTPDGPMYYDYPGRHETPSEGAHRARRLAESMACAAARFTGECDAPRLVCGRTFTLVDAPAGAPEGELVVVAVNHDWERGENLGEVHDTKFKIAFEALPASTAYRPPRVTPSPVISNPLTAFVTGPEGEDIHTDALGRVKVHFPWDRHQLKDDHASHWIPVLQDDTGHSAAIPRVGWEVLVGFVEGDPDRPYVLGRVYNGADPFPEPLPAGKTKSSLRSLSSPGRDGQNEIWIEDAAGSELVSFQAERNQVVVTENDKHEDVKGSEENTIVQNEVIEIGNDQTTHVTGPRILSVEKNQTISVGGSRRREVGAGEQATVDGAGSIKIGGTHMRKVGGFDNVVIEGSLAETIGGVNVEASLQENRTDAAAVQTLTVGGAVLEIAGQGKTEDTEMLRVETIGVGLITKTLSAFDLDVGTSRTTQVGAVMKTLATTIAIKAGTTLKAAFSTRAGLSGSDGLVIKSGGSEVTLTADGITMKSDKDIVISASGAADICAAEAQLNPDK